MRFRLPFHRTLATRLWLAFLLCVAVPVAVVGTLLVLVSERALIDNAAAQSSQTISQIARGIDEEARQIALWAAAIASDEQVLSAATKLAAGPTEPSRALAAQILDKKMISFFDYTNKIGSVQIYFHERSPYIYRNSPYLFERTPEHAPWFRETLSNPGRTRFVDDLQSYSLGADLRPLLSVAIAPSDPLVRRNVELLLVSFRVTSFEPFYSSNVGGSVLVLLDSSGRPILSSSDGVMLPDRSAGTETRKILDSLDHTRTQIKGSESSPEVDRGEAFRVEIQKKPYLVSVTDVASPGWKLVSAVPYGQITRSVEYFSRLARYALILLLLVFAVYIEVSFLEVIRPLRRVVTHMHEVEMGDYSVTVDISGPEEVARLGNAFNSMVREVNRLITEREANERERARLELEALRLQINPHFLSNTLNSIRLMAAMTNAKAIQEMTRALMKVVTDSFGREGALALVRSEIDMLSSYVHIMKVRYGNNFTVNYCIDKEAERLLMLRMLLQPIVENSILHGFQNIRRRGKIDISGRVIDGKLIFVVADNGSGMNRETLCGVFAETETDSLGLSRVGIGNVEKRIRLTHGESYGLSIESVPETGTTVTVRLPVLVPEENDVPRHGGR